MTINWDLVNQAYSGLLSSPTTTNFAPSSYAYAAPSSDPVSTSLVPGPSFSEFFQTNQGYNPALPGALQYQRTVSSPMAISKWGYDPYANLTPGIFHGGGLLPPPSGDPSQPVGVAQAAPILSAPAWPLNVYSS